MNCGTERAEYRERNRSEATAKIKQSQQLTCTRDKGERMERQKLRIWGWERVEQEVTTGNPDRDLEGTLEQSWRWRAGNHPPAGTAEAQILPSEKRRSILEKQ